MFAEPYRYKHIQLYGKLAEKKRRERTTGKVSACLGLVVKGDFWGGVIYLGISV